MDAAQQVHEQFVAALEAGTLQRHNERLRNLGLSAVGLDPRRAAALLHSQMVSRQLDRLSRKLQARGCITSSVTAAIWPTRGAGPPKRSTMRGGTGSPCSCT